MLHPMPVTGHPIAPRPPRSPALVRRRKERTQCSDRLGVVRADRKMLCMCECAPRKAWPTRSNRFRRGFSLYTPYEGVIRRAAEQGLVETKGRLEEWVYRRIAGSAEQRRRAMARCCEPL